MGAFFAAERGRSLDRVPSLASIAVDSHVAAAADLTEVGHGGIPTSLLVW